MTLVILACALPPYNLWWPSFVILFYIFSVIPTLIIKRSMQSALFGPSYVDLSIFLTMGFIVSSFGLPIVLVRCGIILLGASVLTICGNIVVYLTIFGYFLFLDPDETTYGGMA
ncbi:leptin receptor gene-related protein-like [Contarinia nasturtii]|uniref:leptin receptor gene-related protein-like n=1 Tax=Contarinia nasturtii TaxID=265458 RepID=UPI0012D44209|nr:leptin receptor gene-related protein-like [Contarinia nasturtii]